MTMCKRYMKRNRGAQRGYALIGIIAAVGIAATTVLVTSLSSTAVQNEQERKTNASLALAKQALIGRAAADDNRPGSLPCPDNWPADSLNVGTPTTPCDNVSGQIGRLPWKTLGLPDLRDADGERLWYAVSPSFRDATDNIINSNTSGQLYVTGTISAEHVAAIVIAPGAQIHAQHRDGENRQNLANYLESIPYPGYTYVAASPGDDYNDKMMVITPADVFAVVQKRVANEVQLALNEYFAINGRFPFAASAGNSSCMSGSLSAACGSVDDLTTGLISASPEAVAGFPSYPTLSLLASYSSDSTTNEYNWFDKNGWRAVTAYNVSPECTTNTPACTSGSLSVTVNGTTYTNQKVVISFAGVPNGTPEEVLKTAYVKGVQ